MTPVIQRWVCELPMMQQTVLLAAIRGPDGLPKYGPTKLLLRWYRRCVLLSAMDGCIIPDPFTLSGGSFTGPSCKATAESPYWPTHMNRIVDEYLQTLDSIPHHFQLHFMHAVEIVGYKHEARHIREWWHEVYLRLVNDMHLHPETETELDERLGDSREGWLKRADPATVA